MTSKYKILDQFLNEVNEYRLKLISDAELEKYACIIINDTTTAENIKFGLESALFGMTKNESCAICGQNKSCTQHFGLISLPYPIITNTIIILQFKKIVEMICPCCANFPIENIENVLKLKPEERFAWIKSEVEKKYKHAINTCPFCKNNFMFIKVDGNYPDYKYIFNQELANKTTQLNPWYVYTLLNNFSDQSCEYIGFNPQTCHPKNYMTKFIVVIPNRLRIKTLESQSSSITASYRHIIDNINILNKLYHTSIGQKYIIPQNEDGKQFNDTYKKIIAIYTLIIDMTKDSITNACLNAISKRDRQHVEPSASLMGRLKGKQFSYFEKKGIIGTRHQVSARTVIAADTAIHNYELSFPKKFCSQMGYFIPVYDENLELAKQFVASMENVSKYDSDAIKVNKVFKSQRGDLISVKPNRAAIIASQLVAGDKLFVSLIPGSIVLHTRFPCVREESWAAHLLVPSKHTCMALPLSACGYKNADFDGDETQIYANHGNYMDTELLLLNSIFKQCIDYKFGKIGIYWKCDSALEIELLKADTLIGMIEIKDPETGVIIDRVNFWPPKKVSDFIEAYLNYITGQVEGSKYSKIPKINYSDAKTIIKDNKLDSEKCKLNNDRMYVYLMMTIGMDRTLDLIDLIIQLCYNFAAYKPLTLGNEIKFYPNSHESEIKKIHEDTLQKLIEIEKSDESFLIKSLKSHLTNERQKEMIFSMLSEGIKGTNLEATGLGKNTAGYYKMLIAMDPYVLDGQRVIPKLAEHTRTIIGYPRFSIDPAAYGYTHHGYMSNEITVSESFYDCMMQRKGLYIKGNTTAESGYLQKRFLMAFGQNVVDCNGGVLFNDVYVSPCYGACSLNPRYSITLPLKDIDLKPEEFKKKYQDDELLKLYENINDALNVYTKTTRFINTTQNAIFVSGFDYEQFFKIKNLKEGKTDAKVVDLFITNLKKAFAPVGMVDRYALLNLVDTEYYFRQKANEFIIPNEVFIEAYYYFLNSLVDPGEVAGMKAAMSIGEALVQELLDAIHHATGGSVENNRLKFTKSADRFEEILGSSRPKNTIISLGFYDSSKEHAIDYAKKNETIYFKNIWTKLEICVSGKLNSDVIALHPKINFDAVEINKTFIKMIWNLNTLADFDIKLSELFNVLYQNYPLISFITGKVLNTKEFMAYVYFQPNTQKADIDNYIQCWKSQINRNIIHGRLLINCTIKQNKHNNEWIVEANEIDDDCKAFEQIIFDPELDPAKCHSTNTKAYIDMYGMFETGARMVDEIYYTSSELSSVGQILERHFKTIGLGAVNGGKLFIAVANSVEKNECDYLRQINFETPALFIKKAISKGEYQEINDVVSAQFYAELPKSGSGYTKSVIFKK